MCLVCVCGFGVCARSSSQHQRLHGIHGRIQSTWRAGGGETEKKSQSIVPQGSSQPGKQASRLVVDARAARNKQRQSRMPSITSACTQLFLVAVQTKLARAHLCARRLLSLSLSLSRTHALHSLAFGKRNFARGSSELLIVERYWLTLASATCKSRDFPVSVFCHNNWKSVCVCCEKHAHRLLLAFKRKSSA